MTQMISCLEEYAVLFQDFGEIIHLVCNCSTMVSYNPRTLPYIRTCFKSAIKTLEESLKYAHSQQ